MARRPFRRKKKYSWLPTYGLGISRSGQDAIVANPIRLALSVGPGVDIATAFQPLVINDLPVETYTGESLSDAIGGDYVVKRIVGSVFATSWLEGTIGGEFPGATINAMGIFVARADGEDPTGPIGSTAADELWNNYNPLNQACIREPWMFRRLWVLGHRTAVVTATGGASNKFGVQDERQAVAEFPVTTAGYSGLHTGPFFDVKVARRIRNDERLWVVWAAAPYPLGYGGASPTGAWTFRTQATIDYRILGALRKARNRSNF